MKSRCWIGLVVLLLPTMLRASPGTEGAAFLNIPVGAGPAALGSAYTAMANNAYAPVWNPAGLGQLPGQELAAQHTSYLESIHYEYLSYVRPFDGGKRGVGVSVQYLGSGDISRTEEITGNPIGSFSSYYASYNIAYGQKVNDRLSLGVTGKAIRAKIDDVSAGAYAADFGGLYRANDKLKLGASIVNLGSKLKFIDSGDDLPLALRLGGVYQPSSHYLVSAEAAYRKNGLASFHVGGQWRPVEMVSLRAGYRTDTLKGLSPLAGFSTGMGLNLWGQEFSYAWLPFGDLGDAQYFSLVIHFGAADQARHNLIQYQAIKRNKTGLGSQEKSNEMEPEAQQLMQLLQDTDDHVAQVNRQQGISAQ